MAWGTGWRDGPDSSLGGNPGGPGPRSRGPTVLLTVSSPVGVASEMGGGGEMEALGG